jgi:hypothetical protein
MIITVSIANQYGNEVIRPICEQAKLLADLAGTKTLTRAAIATIKRLGYQIEVKQEIKAL